MKVLKSVVVGLVAVGLATFLSTVSFSATTQTPPGMAKGTKRTKGWTAAEKKEHELAQIKLYNDSAAALQKTNPALAEGLTKYANEESQELNEGKEGKGKKEVEGDAAANLKLLRDSAAALQQSNPSLSESLAKTANQHAKKMEMKKEKKETKAKK